jgi:ribA/ribD-fused uncharacterized protein
LSLKYISHEYLERNIIDAFENDYEFLSNFYPSEVSYKGSVYPTSEHAYQAQKCVKDEEQAEIKHADSPGQAKRLGQDVLLRPNWDNIKTRVMYKVVRAKFNQHTDLRQKLLDTKPAVLIEGNDWGDQFWGVTKNGGNNQLGKVLMIVRSEFSYG